MFIEKTIIDLKIPEGFHVYRKNNYRITGSTPAGVEYYIGQLHINIEHPINIERLCRYLNDDNF